MSSNQDWYICMQVRDFTRPELTEVCGVNITELVCNNSRPQLELLHQSEFAKEGRYAPFKHKYLFKNYVTNTVHQLELPGSHNIVTTIDNKLYVLVRSPALFKVYDPFHNSWQILPPPPCSNTHPSYSYEHFEWGHMLGVYDSSRRGPSYVFDTIEEKWMSAVALPPLVCAVEFSGFLVGVECSLHNGNRLSIVAYKLDDENGLPDSNSKHTLDDELWELFYPPLTPYRESSFLYRFADDDQVLLVSTIERIQGRLIVVAVFRVSISTVGGLQVVSAVFEHKQVYNLEDDECSYISSTFLMQNAPSYVRRHISSMSINQPLQDDDANIDVDLDKAFHEEDDDIAPVRLPSKVQTCTIEKYTRADVKWDDGLKEKSMYMCFVENKTDSSVSYIIKAMKISDLISTSSHDSKLHQVASKSGYHLACLPSCGVFGSLILFAGGGDENYLREVDPIEDEIYSDPGFDPVEIPQQVPSSRDIYFYDATSDDSNIKRFTKCFKGMKPQPVLAEVEGKLYALAGFPKPKYMNPVPFFEMFDPIETQWSPLPDPPSYTKFLSSSNYHAIAGTNLLSWGSKSPGVFRFDMAADSIDKDWRLINNSSVLTGDEDQRSTIVVDSDGNGGGDFVLFTYKIGWSALQVHLISRDFDNVVCLPILQLPESVSSFLNSQNACRSSFVDLGGRRVCLVVSCAFSGPYGRDVYQLGEGDDMSIVIVVFEFEVAENRESVAPQFVFHRILEYHAKGDANSDARRNPETSDTHMVGAFLL